MKTIVIGGGLIGLSTAQVLAASGEPVQVLESCAGIATETSFANGGLLTPSMSEPWNGPGVLKHLLASLFDPYSAMKLRLSAVPSYLSWGLKFLRNSTPERFHAVCQDNYRLASYSLQQTLAITKERELVYDFGRGGTLSVFRDRHASATQQQIALRLTDAGMRSQVLTADEVVQREPALAMVAKHIVSGIWYPDDVRGDAHKFCHELARLIRAGGGDIRTGTEVSGLIVKNGRIAGVRTKQREMAADRVIVAAGVATPALLQTVGERVFVKPAKGYSVTFDADGMSGVPGLPVQDDAMHAAVVPIGRRVRLVGTAEFAGFDKRLDETRVDNLFRLLKAVLPELAAQVSRSQATAWTNLRPMSSDGRPYIGATRTPGLFVNTGHGPLGWTMAMGSAHMLADQLAGRKPAIDPVPFGVQRR